MSEYSSEDMKTYASFSISYKEENTAFSLFMLININVQILWTLYLSVDKY